MDDSTLEDLLRRLTVLVVKLDARDEHILALLDEQREMNRQQIAINQRLEVTQARIETLLARMIAQGENGQEA